MSGKLNFPCHKYCSRRKYQDKLTGIFSTGVGDASHTWVGGGQGLGGYKTLNLNPTPYTPPRK